MTATLHGTTYVLQQAQHVLQTAQDVRVCVIATERPDDACADAAAADAAAAALENDRILSLSNITTDHLLSAGYTSV